MGMGRTERMRKLYKICTAIFPNCAKIPIEFKNQQASVSDMIFYFKTLLGDQLPRPEWKLMLCWRSCLARWFTLVLGREITEQEASECVFRPLGMGWKADIAHLESLGLFTHTWKHPITLPEVRFHNDRGKAAALAYLNLD